MNMSDIKITIMTPTYNRSSFLPKLYETLTKQTVDLTMMEWIIVDDGSTDDTEDIVHKLKEKSPFGINYIKSTKHAGVCSSNFFRAYGADSFPENHREVGKSRIGSYRTPSVQPYSVSSRKEVENRLLRINNRYKYPYLQYR